MTEQKEQTTEDKIVDEIMLEEFGESYTKGYFEETNMEQTGRILRVGVKQALKERK